MHRSRALSLILLAILALCISCTKTEYSVSDLKVQSYVRTDGIMGLSVYVLPQNSSSGSSGKKLGSVQMVVRTPDGNLSWSFQAVAASFDRLVYYGSSDLCMPSGVELPKGLWSVEVAFSNGSSAVREFEVAYSDPMAALAAYNSSGLSEVFFDEARNLTVVPVP